MGLFDFFSKKPLEEQHVPILPSAPDEVVGAIRLVKDKDGENYMHIKDFVVLMRQYQTHCADEKQVALLDQIINELIKAK